MFAIITTDLIKKIAPHIDDKVAESYLTDLKDFLKEETLKLDPNISDRLLRQKIQKEANWHIKRLAGFGGSDMAVLFTEFQDQFHPFSSADSIVAQKLGLVLPEKSTGDLERGTVLEPIIREKFISLFSHRGIEPDLEAWDALKENMETGGLKKYPWMRSSPDDIFITNDGKRILVDYKSPASESTVTDLKEEVPDYYKAQLGQYRMHLEELGYKIDETYLVPLSLKEMIVYPLNLPESKEIEKTIAEAGNHYWDYVLKNELPRRPPNMNFEYIDEVPLPMKNVMSEYILTKKLESKVKKDATELKRKVLEQASRFGIEYDEVGKKTRIPGLDITRKSSLKKDNKAIETAFIELGGDITEDRFNKESESTTVSIIRSKKTEHEPYISSLDEIASQLLADAKEELEEYESFGMEP